MIKETKKAPTIRFRGFTDDWERRKLGDIVQITMGQSPKGSTYSEEPSDYILVQGNADLENGWVKPRIWTTQKTKTADAGDLIMSVRAPAGAMAKTAYSVVIGRGVAAIKGNEFIFQTLLKMDFEEYWKKLATGSTFEAINSDTLFNANIMVSSQSEQEEIGKFFIHIDSLITLHQRKLEQQKKLKAFFLKYMFPEEGETVPRIRFKEFTGDWEQLMLGEISSVIDPHPSHRAPAETESGIPFIGIGDVDEAGNINYSTARIVDEKIYDEHHKRYDLAIPSVGIGRVASLGKVIRLRNDIGKYAVSPTMSIIQFSQEADVNYMYSCMSSPYFQQQFTAQSSGSTRQSVGIQDLRRFMIPIPQNKIEQINIGTFFWKLDSIIILQQRKLDQLQVMKKFMLQNLFV
jgi:type I restriction enzyme S subunit